MPTLLAIIPHPDDEAYSFGGTIALAAAAGWRCLVHCASAGEGGKRHDGGPAGATHTGDAREAELAAACAVLGAEAPVVWGLADGGLKAMRPQAGRIDALLRATRPDLVLALGADGAYGHPDHVALHEWVVDGWHGLRPPRPPLLFAAFPRGLFLPQYERCVGMMGDPPEPPPSAIGSDSWDYTVAIAAVRDVKLAAIRAHRTQLPGGDPEAIFPPGIAAGLLEAEHFTDARGAADAATAALLARLAGSAQA